MKTKHKYVLQHQQYKNDYVGFFKCMNVTLYWGELIDFNKILFRTTYVASYFIK